MGFFSALTGSDSRRSSTGTSTKDISQAQTGTTRVAGTTSQTTLDAGTIAQLQTLIHGSLGANAAAGSADAAAIRALIPQLTANTDPGAVQSQIKSAQADATRQFNLGEGANIGNLIQQIGSRGNSAAVQLQQQGGVDLATSLAGVAGNINAQARTQRSTDLSTAISGLQAAQGADAGPLTQLLAAIQALSGAQTTQQTDQTQTVDMLSHLFGTDTTVGVEKGTSSQGLFPTITNLIGALSR